MMKIDPLCFILISLISIFEITNCELSTEGEKSMIGISSSSVLGGNQNDAAAGEIENIGRFAVQEHNKKENSLLEFVRVIKASEQVVGGKMYHLILEVNDAGKKMEYEAQIWVKPWMNFKQLQAFKHAPDASSLNTNGRGAA